MSDLIAPWVACPNCGGEVNPERRPAFVGHRMIFEPGWMHHGEPDWECDPPPPTPGEGGR